MIDNDAFLQLKSDAVERALSEIANNGRFYDAAAGRYVMLCGEPPANGSEDEDGAWTRWQSVHDEVGTLVTKPF